MANNSFMCCGYVGIKGLMCDDCSGWTQSKIVNFTKKENELNKPCRI